MAILITAGFVMITKLVLTVWQQTFATSHLSFNLHLNNKADLFAKKHNNF
jgi:hypothetical protein